MGERGDDVTDTVLIFWVVCGIAGAVIGSTKDQVVIGFLAGVLLGPIGVLIVILFAGRGKRCPHCAELIKPNAAVCKHCRRSVREGYSGHSGRSRSRVGEADELFPDPEPPPASSCSPPCPT